MFLLVSSRHIGAPLLKKFISLVWKIAPYGEKEKMMMMMSPRLFYALWWVQLQSSLVLSDLVFCLMKNNLLSEGYMKELYFHSYLSVQV